METLAQFKQRTHFVHEPLQPYTMMLNPNLSLKVNDEGCYQAFYGDTVVYLLSEKVQNRLKEIQNLLYQHCEDLFAQPLSSDTFHCTLHDLNNGSDVSLIESEMSSTFQQIQNLFNTLKQKNCSIKMKSTKVFSMVNTSVVLCLEPASDEDCQLLTSLYDEFQNIVPLSYQLTPHITLAYYNAAYVGYNTKGCIPEERIKVLFDVIHHINNMEPIELELTMDNLVYQRFTSMNHYDTILK